MLRETEEPVRLWTFTVQLLGLTSADARLCWEKHLWVHTMCFGVCVCVYVPVCVCVYPGLLICRYLCVRDGVVGICPCLCT